MSWRYALAYRVGLLPWERSSEAMQAQVAQLLDREQADRTQPLGRALDIGCGRGSRTVDLAARGWSAVGIDNIPRAIVAATARNTSSATFLVADVTHLDAKQLGTFAFFLDVGCFHGLNQQQRRLAGRALTSVAHPGATLLMLAFQPNGSRFLPGVSQESVEGALTPWEKLSVDAAVTTGMPRAARQTQPQWYRLRRLP